jgi:hypothetical protein
MPEVNEMTTQKTGPGARKGNHNASKHDVHPAKAALTRFGKKAVNQRTRSGRAYKSLYIEFLSTATRLPVEQLQNAPDIRTAEKLLTKCDLLDIEALTADGWMVHVLNAAIVQLPNIVRRDRTLVPLIEERDARLASYERRREAFRRRYQQRRPTFVSKRDQKPSERAADVSSSWAPLPRLSVQQGAPEVASHRTEEERPTVGELAVPCGSEVAFASDTGEAAPGSWRLRLEQRRQDRNLSLEPGHPAGGESHDRV